MNSDQSIFCEKLEFEDFDRCVEVLDSAYGHDLSRNERFSDDFETSFLNLPSDLRKYVFYGIKIEGFLVGFGAIAKGFVSEAIWELAWGTVHKEYQGKGLGKNLLHYRIQQILQLKDTETAIAMVNSLPSSLFLNEGFQPSFDTGNNKTLLWKQIA